MNFAQIITLIALAIPQAQGAAAPGGESVERQLIRLKHEIGRAYLERDVAALERIYADDYTVVYTEGGSLERAEEIERMKAGGVSYESVSFEDASARVHGDTAVLVGRSTVKGRNKSGPFHVQYVSTTVFVKQGGQWRASAGYVSCLKRL
jgi:ketosteroid isomerase-like protein